MRLCVSDNQRFLIHEDGSPFFALGDTAWELFHRLTREEADLYLRTRSEQGFTVIQAVALAEHQYQTPNAYGDLPLHDNDPERPNERYFAHVDWIVNRAADLGMWLGMLPTWGDKWNRKWGAGPEIFTPSGAHAYGRYIGARYRERPILWILGGDRPVETAGHRDVITAMAAGLSEGDGGRHLMTFHPMGQETSSRYFHTADWLDFNMYQTGHSRDRDCYNLIAGDYALDPPKPCLDGEPGYEDHPNGFKPENGYLDDYDVRKSAYWDLFAGACGHTYGCHDIWQFLDVERFPAVSAARTPWREALRLPGAEQMRHARSLIESHPFLTRIPDNTMVASQPEGAGRHIGATRDANGSFALFYFPTPAPAEIDLRSVSREGRKSRWFNPRTGSYAAGPDLFGADRREIVPPPDGPDWVLVVETE